MTLPGPSTVVDGPSAKAWLRALVDADRHFHLEDDPSTIETYPGRQPLFSDGEVGDVREAVRRLYGLDPSVWGEYDCPIGYMMAYEEDAIRRWEPPVHVVPD